MIAVGATDKGRRRKDNQDNYYINVLHSEKQALCIICDGMGGARAGNVASDMALTIFAAEVKKRRKPGMSAAYMKAIMREALKIANDSTYEKSNEDEAYRGMGSTIVAIMVDEPDCCIMNVGDSRAYLVSRREIKQITSDHSMAEEMVKRGELTPKAARVHPAKNYITRAVGTEPGIEAEFYEKRLEPGDIILLCSDGLSNMLEDDEILFEVVSGGDIATCPERLIDIANERGGPDNITVVLLAV
jgi:serine/threonine protein phosphatase PrpC